MLTLVATPIGDPNEITLRALEILKEAEVIFCESTKEASQLLRKHQITGKKYELINEHTTSEELDQLLEICRTQKVALVSDCGTPGFCDPGADLVRLCRKHGIPVKSALGASSLMGLISLSGVRLDEFLFRGFIPAENQAREKAYLQLQKEKRSFILMDTPYRFQKMLAEVEKYFPSQNCVVVTDLSQPQEDSFAGPVQKLRKKSWPEKAEFMILVLSLSLNSNLNHEK